MNAKEKQTKFIKLHLKPFLKSRDYKNSNQTWWKDRGDFYNVMGLPVSRVVKALGNY